jgi:hypothetical protein
MPTGNLFKQLKEQDTSLAAELERIYEEALEIWKSPYLSKYTDHGKSHIDQVTRNLDNLTRPLQHSDQALTSAEIYVLLAACYLHDIGMQQDVPDARERHAQYAFELILYSHALVEGQERKVTLSIRDTAAREAIAQIARAHWVSFALELEEEPAFIRDDNTRGRLKLLGVLLAMADLFDLSPVRARYYHGTNRLTSLDAVGALHQGTHAIVKGCEIIVPVLSLASDLRFHVEWRGEEIGDAGKISEWILTWFASQWRRLHRELTRLSAGAIRWADPWVSTKFTKVGGPDHVFPPMALRCLNAEIHEQRRIDRDDLLTTFRSYIENKERKIVFLVGDSSSDVGQISDWIYHNNRHKENLFVARVALRPSQPIELSSAVAQILEQWESHQPQSGDDAALQALQSFLKQHSDSVFIILIESSHFENDLFGDLLKTLFVIPDSSVICLVAAERESIADLNNGIAFEVVRLNRFAKEIVMFHLTEKLGFDLEKSADICAKMVSVKAFETPSATYDYINSHCGACET